MAKCLGLNLVEVLYFDPVQCCYCKQKLEMKLK